MFSKSPVTLCLFYLIFSFFSPVKNVSAADSPEAIEVVTSSIIKITEFMPNPLDGNEWVEVYNSSDNPLNMSGWYLDDIDRGKAGSPYIISGSVVPPHSYLALDFPNNSTLNNSEDSVRILDSQKQVVVSLSYGSVKSGYSISLIGDNWEFSSSTKGTVNPASVSDESSEDDEEDEEEINYPDNIKITEFMPCPKKGDKEWVEIYNDNDEGVELTDWKIDDKDGGSSPQLFSAAIKEHKYAVIELSSSKLNNSGEDEVRILNPDGKEVDKTSYKGCITEYSYALDGEEFKLTSKTTPGDDNEFDEKEEEEVEESEGEPEENIKKDNETADKIVQEVVTAKVSMAEIPKTFEIQNVPEILGESTSVDSNDDLETIDPSGKLPIILLIPIPALFAILGVIIKRLL